MKIWYQSYSALGFDPRWNTYEEYLKKLVKEVARPDTEVNVFGVQKIHPRMIESDYILYLHVSQVIERALQAEREGYDAFVIGGSLDPGAPYIRELLDIPVAFIGESSFYTACMLAPKFSVIASDGALLRRQTQLIESYGLSQRFVPGAHLDRPNQLELVNNMGKDPQSVINLIKKAASKPIDQGAGAFVLGFAAVSAFLAAQGVRDIEGVPIIDGTAVVIKTAEMLVDLKKMGVKRGKKGVDISPVPKPELMASRKFYGIEK